MILQVLSLESNWVQHRDIRWNIKDLYRLSLQINQKDPWENQGTTDLWSPFLVFVRSNPLVDAKVIGMVQPNMEVRKVHSPTLEGCWENTTQMFTTVKNPRLVSIISKLETFIRRRDFQADHVWWLSHPKKKESLIIFLSGDGKKTCDYNFHNNWKQSHPGKITHYPGAPRNEQIYHIFHHSSLSIPCKNCHQPTMHLSQPGTLHHCHKIMK